MKWWHWRAIAFILLPFALFTINLPDASAASKPAPKITWLTKSFQPSRSYKLTSLVSTNSKGKKTWRASGSCSLTKTALKTGRSGTCRLTLSVAATTIHRSVSKSFSISLTTTTTSTTTTTTTTTTTVPTTTTTTVPPPPPTTTTLPLDPVQTALATQAATFPERSCLHYALGDDEYDKVITGLGNNSHRAALGNCLSVFGATAPSRIPIGSAAELAVTRSHEHFNSMPATTTDRFNIVVNPSTPAWLETKLRAAILGTARFYGTTRLPSVNIIIGTNDEWTAEEIALGLFGSRTANIEGARNYAEMCTSPDAYDNLSGCALASNEYVNPNDPSGRRWTSYPILIMGYGARLRDHRWHDSSASSTMPHELSHVVQWLSNGTATDRATRLAEFNIIDGTCQFTQCDVGWSQWFQTSLLEGQSTFFGAVIADIIGQDRYKDPFDQYSRAVSPTVNLDMAHYLWANYPSSYWQGGDAGYFDPRYYVTGLGTELMVAQFGVEKTLAFQKSFNYRYWYDADSTCSADPCPGLVALVNRQATEFQQIFGVSIGTWMIKAHDYISRRHAGQYPTLADVGLTMVSD